MVFPLLLNEIDPFGLPKTTEPTNPPNEITPVLEMLGFCPSLTAIPSPDPTDRTPAFARVTLPAEPPPLSPVPADTLVISPEGGRGNSTQFGEAIDGSDPPVTTVRAA